MEGQYEIRARGEAYTLSRRFPSAAPQRDREELPPAAAAILIRSCAADSSALPQLRRALAGIESRQDLASLGNAVVVERLVSLIEAGRLGLSRGRRGAGEAPMEIPLPVLRLGSQGADVRKLQVLLNARMRPSPNMKTDGVFGIVTDKAVRNFQKSRLVPADGIVGRETWRHLLAPETGTPVVPVPKGPAHGAPAAPPGRASAAGAAPATTDARSPVPPTQAVPGAPAPPSTPAAQPAPESIIEWPLERKLKEVLSRVPARLPGELRTQFLQMVSFEALAVGLATIAVALLFPAAGQVLLVGMLLLLGKEVVTELGEGLRETAFASTPQELDVAAEHLARAFTMAGIAVLLAAIARFAKRPAAAKAAPAEPAPAASGSLREPTRTATRRTTQATDAPSQTNSSSQRPPAAGSSAQPLQERPTAPASRPPVIQRGGAHGEVQGQAGYESHHMPANSVSPLETNKGPAIAMQVDDHRLTASWGNSREARAYRAKQAELIEQGGFRDAQRMDIEDVRAKFGDKYDAAIKQMMDYTDSLGP